MNLKNLFKVFAFVACVVLFAACETGKGPELTDEQMKEVYLFGNCKKPGMHGSLMGVADDQDHTYSAASLLSMVKVAEKGTHIIGIRAYVGGEVTDASVWVGEDYENPTTVKEFTYKEGGWQYVLFDEPIKLNVNNADFYIGYTITGKGSVLAAESASKSYKSEWISIDNGTWSLLSKAAGNALWSIQAIVAGGDYSSEKQHDIAVEMVELPTGVTAGDPVDVTCEVRNAGIKTTSNIEVKCTFGGSSVTATVSEPLKNGQSAKVVLPAVTAPKSSGLSDIVISVEEFNAVDEKTSDNKFKKSLRVYTETTERNNLFIEQFTGQDCGNCPGGSKQMASSIDGMKDPSKAVWVAHHAGYYDDSFTLPESKTIASSLGVNAAPMCNINRTPRDYGLGKEELIWHPGYATTKMLESALNEPGLATIEMNRTYNAETRELTVEVKGRALESTAYITAIVTQSGIEARQAGGSASYVHNNAPRAFLTEAKGDKLELDEAGNYTFTATYTIPEKVGTFDCLPENMNVVAFIHGSISDSKNRLVYNAEQVTVVPEVDAAVMRAMTLYNEVEVDVFNIQLKPWAEQICQ